MIVIDDTNKLVEWLDKLPDLSIGRIRLDIAILELSNGLDTELIAISASSFANLSLAGRRKLESVAGVLIFSEGEVENITKNTLDVVNMNSSLKVIANQVRLLDTMVRSQTILKSQLITMNKEMSEILGGVETQILRVKHFYERNMPKRFDNLKGISILSKYASGESMGGEFFDLFESKGKIFMMMSSTSSYMISTSILELFSEMKAHGSISIDSELNIINQVRNDILEINKNKKKKIVAEIFTCILDLNTLELKGYSLGGFNLLSSTGSLELNDQNTLSTELREAMFSFELERGERIILNSPGFNINWRAASSSVNISELISNNSIKILDILDELFFQLKKNAKNGLMAYDASSIVLEVKRNVMVKI